MARAARQRRENELPYIPFGPFHIRFPFIHYKIESQHDERDHWINDQDIDLLQSFFDKYRIRQSVLSVDL